MRLIFISTAAFLFPFSLAALVPPELSEYFFPKEPLVAIFHGPQIVQVGQYIPVNGKIWLRFFLNPLHDYK